MRVATDSSNQRPPGTAVEHDRVHGCIQGRTAGTDDDVFGQYVRGIASGPREKGHGAVPGNDLASFMGRGGASTCGRGSRDSDS